ncbi:MAG TPA: HYR domain-containing protein [Planctomycetes bacterium]|nr:HYR domain-containing protein [Planctomycetota bacterium]
MSPRITYLLALIVLGILHSPVDLFAQCQPTVDCNQNGVADQCDIDLGTSDDCNGNLVPDECDISFLVSEDCNLDGIPDECNPGVTELIGLGLAFGQGFGESISSSSEFAIVGAPLDDLLGTDTGSANIFRRTGTLWIEEMKLFGVASTLNDRFGTAVAVEGDLVAVGAPGKLQERGAVFLFRRIGNGWWNYESTITAFDSQPGWLFGNSLDIEDGSVLVGAPMNGFAGGAGAVYSYSLNAGQWLLDEKIEHSNGLPGDRFGSSVVQAGGRMAVGAPGRDSGLIANSGAALVFEESAGVWLESAFKEPMAPQPLGLYGLSVALNRDHLLVGAPGEDSGAGSAYIYDRLSSMWINPERLAPDATSAGSFGLDVGLSIRTAVVGAPMAGISQGTVCVYRYESGSWIVQDGFLPPELQMPGTEFGKSISCEVPFLLVGCPGELYGDAVWISSFTDCNLNLEDDVCDVTQGLELDCNLNQIPDSCEISDGSKQDCDGNGIPDECQIVAGELIDCNLNGVPDDCDIVQGFSLDCNLDSIPDDCQVNADPFNPVISNLPDPISVVTEPGQCGAVITWNPPVATDDCGISSITSSRQSGEFFTPGLTIVTYTATDVSGNQSNAMFTVLVHDEELPGISGLQPLFTVQAPIGTCEAPVSWPAPTPTDNCGIFSTLVDHLPGSVFPVGITAVIYTVMDVHGNVSEFPFQVEVLDNHFPEILGISGDLSVVSDPGSCTAVVNWTEPTPQDDCVISSFESTHASGEAFPIGVTEVVYTVADSSGLTATASFSISVMDDQAPTFLTAPADITMGNDPDDCGAVVGWVAATTSDNCAIASVTSSHQPGDHFPLGTTQVDVTALDVNGNSTSHSFAVVVNDTQMPVLTGVPADIILNNDAGQCSATYNWLLPEFTDNCGVASFNGTHDSGTTFPSGPTTVSYVLTDLSGNILESSFVVTVEDVELPEISGLPTSFSVANDPGQCGANVSWVPPVASDNCSVADFDASHLPGIFLPIGITTIHYSVMDGTGLTTLASFEILVDDEEAPMINGMPADRTIEAAPGLCSVVHDWVAPLASDNCTVVTFDATHQPGDAFSVGTTEVVYTATDSTGMVTTEQFLITVVDTEAPTIIRIPADISILAEAGICSAVADWIAPDSQDNCGIVSFSISHPSGTTFPTGDTLVSILTEDLHGNTAQASFTVTVLDQQEPILSQIPADITMAAETGICAATVTWTEPLASDNCAVATFGSDLSSGHQFPIGTHPVTYSAIDLNGNISEASFLVTITDDEAPSIDGVLTDVVISNDPAICGAIHEWIIPVIADNCGLSSSTASHLPGDLFPHGLSTVVYSVTDDSGNTTSASFDVTVVDLELPVISGMPLDVTLDSDAGACGALHSWILPEATDNCQILSFLSSHESGSLLPVGVNDISYTAQDATGNLITAGFSVTVLDVEAPIISGTSPDLFVATDSGLCTAMVSWIPETGTDNCGILSHTSSRSTGDDFEVGTSVVQISVIDIHGNESIDSFSVTVTDQELPQISQMPADISITAEPSICGATVNWIEPTGSDNCTMATFTSSLLSGSFFEVGTTPVTYSAVDVSGNSSESTFLVTITDDEAPQIENVLVDVTLSTELGLCGATHGWIIPALTDNCGIASTSASHPPGSFFPKGQTTVSYSITDTAGLTTSASFDVTVVDLELPVISGMPLDVTLDSDAGACGALHSWILPEATDNCEISSLVSSHQPGDLFPIGISTVTITTQDASSNIAASAFTVTVMDIESPVLSGFPPSIEVNTDPGNCTAVVDWIREIPTDNCGISEHTSSRLPGDIFEIGLNTVEVSVTDIHGNQTAQQFTITVIDQESPVISGTPQDVSIICDAGLCGATVTWIEPTASDNCQTIGLASDVANGSFLPVGSHNISYSVSDSSGNEVISSFAITISDTEAPQIISFPTDMSIETDPGQCGAVVTWAEPLVSDNCGIASSSLDRLNGEYLAKGDHLVTGLFEDIHGNTTTQAFTVTVVDLELPTIVGLPLDISLTTLPDNCGASADWTSPIALDNCPGQNLAVNFPSGSFFAVGITEIRYVATDSSGNVLEQNFNVLVVDDLAPVFDGVPADITVTTDLGDCSGQVSWIPETVSDNCGILEHTSSHMPGDSFAIGSTTVEIAVTDLHGNQVLESFMVTVTDDEAPIIGSLPADITVTTQTGVCGSVVTWLEPTAADNCGAINLQSDVANGNLFPVGSTLVTYSVEDLSGNTSSESFLVMVTEDEPPVIVGMPQNISVSTDPGLCGASVDWIAPTTTDNCQVASQTSTHQQGDFFPVGMTTVLYTSTDTAGNQHSESFTIEVQDQENPEFTNTPVDAIISVDPGMCSAVHLWTSPIPVDNCGIASLSSDIQSGHTFSLGSTPVSYSTTDLSGNISNFSFTVEVIDDEEPIISGVPSQVLVNNIQDQCGAIAEWVSPTAADNCEMSTLTSSHTSGSDFPVGETTVTLTATDAAGNSSISTFPVYVVDIQIPVILGLPGQIDVNTDIGVCGAVVNWDEPTAVDNCAVDTLVTNIASGNLFNVGSTTVTYTVTDVNGNTMISNCIVTVADHELPEFVNPTGDILLTSEPGVCDAQAFWSEIVVTDACGVDSLLGTHASGDRFNVGTSTVDYTATDANGNISIHSFQVIVTDEELPVITGTPLEISVETDPGVCGAVVTWAAPLASDNCGVNSFENTHDPGDLFPVGETLVSYTVQDVNANQVTESFTLTVLDTESPQISGLPQSIQVSTDTGNCTAVVNWIEPTVTDNCTVISVLSSHSSGDVFPIGDTLVTYGVMDSAGIVIHQPFLITVTDDELPLISNVPADMVVSVDAGVCGASVSWASPMATDNCGVADLASDHENGALYPVGTTLVTYNSTDVHGNVGTNSFSITVEDLELPTLTGLPLLIELDAELDLCGAMGSWTAPVLNDNCEVAEITQTHMSGDFFPVGSTTVLYTVTDSAGNMITHAMSIVVTDVQAPTITQVPSDMVLDTTPGDCGRVAAWAQPLISDACGAFTTTSTHSTGDFFNPGITQVVYTAIDQAGNVATATFSVLVTDNELPVIVLIPEDQVVSAPVGSCSATANWITPTASDNCGVAQIDLSISSGSEFSVGTTSVLITATDTGGNQATAAFQITVLDQVDPQIVGMPADMILSSDLDQCGATVDWLEPVGVDGCNLLTFESNMQPASFFPVGITIVTYVATDESGNSVSASFSITILDEENPIVSAPVPVTVTAPEGSCSAYVDVPELIVSDRCGSVSVTNDYNGTANASGVFPRGNTMINWMATDDSGNQSTAVGVVTVIVDSPDCNLNGVPDSCDIIDGISIDCNQDGIPDECQADCDGDGIPNDCEIELGTAFDCDADGYPDDCAIVNGVAADCDQDGVIDSCEILAGIESDCDQSGILDSCELSTGSAMDCNGNGQIDSCDIASAIELDCDLNGIVDSCQIATGASSDCDLDGVIDSCEVAAGAEADCDGNGSLDSCDLASGVVEDCNQNMVPDSCDLASGVAVDCNANGSLDICDIASGIANDCDGNSVVDSCEIASGAAPDCDSNGAIDSCDVLAGVVTDCNGSGVPDSCEVSTGAVPDCNNNGIPDSCDIASGGVDCNQSGVLDSCEIASGELPDCNQNGALDTCDIASGIAEDCDQSGIPDNCEISTNQVADCNSNGIPDSCDLSSGVEQDCDGSGVPDSCEVQSGTTSDCNLNGVPDSCDIASGVWSDCDLDGVIDTCEIEQGTEQDCNATGIPDSCEIFSGDANDCDGNLIPDSCDLIEGTLQDCNGNGQPDECEVAAGTVEDCNGNGIPDSCDLSNGIEIDEDLNGIPDSCQLNFRRGDGNNDGIVNIADGVFLLTNLFAGGSNPTCDDAADANDDGNIDVSDIISILGFQFNGSSPPPPPFVNCGVDPTVNDGLGCILYSACP